jgi:hypothetical protein
MDNADKYIQNMLKRKPYSHEWERQQLQDKAIVELVQEVYSLHAKIIELESNLARSAHHYDPTWDSTF